MVVRGVSVLGLPSLVDRTVALKTAWAAKWPEMTPDQSGEIRLPGKLAGRCNVSRHADRSSRQYRDSTRPERSGLRLHSQPGAFLSSSPRYSLGVSAYYHDSTFRKASDVEQRASQVAHPRVAPRGLLESPTSACSIRGRTSSAHYSLLSSIARWTGRATQASAQTA